MIDDSGLTDIRLRHDEALELLRTGSDGYGQGSADRLQTPVETQFTYHHILRQTSLAHLPVGGEDADGKGQVVAAALLADIRRREVDGDVGSGRLEADIPHGRTDTVVTLLDGGIGQSRQAKLHPSGHIHFDGDSRGFQSHDGCTECLDKHSM